MIEDKKSISQKCESLTASFLVVIFNMNFPACSGTRIVNVLIIFVSVNFLACSRILLIVDTRTQVEMRTAERRSKENVKAMESRHNLEMSRIKQVLFGFPFDVIVMVVGALRIKQILSIYC